MQYQTNRMSQCRDISRKPNFGPNLGLNGPNLGRKFFFQPQDHPCLLDIMSVYHNMQNQKNVIIQTRENDQKPQIWSNLDPFCPILAQKILFSKIGLHHFLKLITKLMDKLMS